MTGIRHDLCDTWDNINLFQDVYEFAGTKRTVNIAKGNFRFAPVMYLDAALDAIDKMPQSTFDQIVKNMSR